MACLAIAAVASLLAAVGGEREREAPPAPEPAISVVVRPASLRLRAGESRQLAAQANDAAGAPIGGAPLVCASKTPAGATDALRTTTGDPQSGISGAVLADPIAVRAGQVGLVATERPGAAAAVEVVAGRGRR